MIYASEWKFKLVLREAHHESCPAHTARGAVM